jgi:hypothetical protein
MDKELESLRDLYAGMAMLGLITKGVYRDDIARISFEIADSMLETRTTKEGIVSVNRQFHKGE